MRCAKFRTYIISDRIVVMAKETERRFLVKSDEWRSSANGGVHYLQGYLTTDPERNVRIRIGDDAASLTIKGAADGFTRPEFEYSVPLNDAEDIKKLCLEPILEKTRYTIQCNGLTWEVDEYDGENKGLVLAEVETHSDAAVKHVPTWVGEDISSDERYQNINLVEHPFSRWSDKEKPQTTFSLKHGELSKMVFIASLPSSFPSLSTNYPIRKAPWILLSMKRANV